MFNPTQNQTAQPPSSNYRTPVVALLVDAENISYVQANRIMELAQREGIVAIRRIYADWSNPAVIKWKEPVKELNLDARQQFSLASGKNSSDMALIVDAMDLVFKEKFDCLVLATSDSDFTPLVSKLREYGIKVVGIGNQNASVYLTRACHYFHYLMPPTPSPARSKYTPTAKATVKPAIKQSATLIAPVSAISTPAPQMEIALPEIEQVTVSGSGETADLPNPTMQTNDTADMPNPTVQTNDTVEIPNSTMQTNATAESTDMPAFDTSTSAMIPSSHESVAVAQVPEPVEQSTPTYETKPKEELVNMISQVISTIPSPNGWFSVGRVANTLSQYGVSASMFGYATLSHAIADMPNIFELREREQGDLLRDKRSDYKKPFDKKLINGIRNVIRERRDQYGWVSVAILGSHLGQNGIKPKDYGYRNFTLLLKEMPQVEVLPLQNDHFVRWSPQQTKPVGQSHPTVDTRVPVNPVETTSYQAVNELNDTGISPYTNQPTVLEVAPQVNTADEQATHTTVMIDESTDVSISTDVSVQAEHLDVVPEVSESIETDLFDQEETLNASNLTQEQLMILIHQAIATYQNADGYCKVGDIGKYIRKTIGVGSTHFGFADFGKMLEQIGGYEIIRKGYNLLVKPL